MLLAAAALISELPCIPSQIAAAATVSQPEEVGFDAIGISQVDGGFRKPIVQQIAWAGPCAPRFVRSNGGGTLVTDGHLLLSVTESRVEVRNDQTPAVDPEPPHPTWKGRRFEGSANLMAGTWRIGAWSRPEGKTDFARYRTDTAAEPIPLLTLTRTLVGVFYLPAPDTAGGTLYFTQRLGRSRFRMVSMVWSEKGLRSRL